MLPRSLDLPDRIPPHAVLLPERLGERAEGPLRHALQDRPPRYLAGRSPDEVRHLQGVAGDAEDAGCCDLVDVRAKLPGRGGDLRTVQAEQLRPGHLLPVIEVPAGFVQTPNREPFEQELRIDQAGVHPQQELRVGGVVGDAGDLVDPVDALVDEIDPAGRFQGLLPRPEGDRVGHLQRALEALPRVALVEPRLASAGQYEWVGGLHQQGTRAAEQHGRLPVDLPGDRTRPEQPRFGRHIAGHPTTVRAGPRVAGPDPGNVSAR